MKKFLVCVAATVLIVAGAFTARNLIWEYGHSGEPDVTGMLVVPEDGSVLIEEGQVPLAAGPDGGAGENPYIQQVVDLVNEQRTAAGLNPLEKSSEVCAAADVRAREIAASFSHIRPDGRRYRTVLTDLGISSHFSGENIAGGYRTPSDVVSAWMNSPGHKENIMNPDYTHIGIGYYPDSGSGLSYWCQLFIY